MEYKDYYKQAARDTKANKLYTSLIVSLYLAIITDVSLNYMLAFDFATELNRYLAIIVAIIICTLLVCGLVGFVNKVNDVKEDLMMYPQKCRDVSEYIVKTILPALTTLASDLMPRGIIPSLTQLWVYYYELNKHFSDLKILVGDDNVVLHDDANGFFPKEFFVHILRMMLSTSEVLLAQTPDADANVAKSIRVLSDNIKLRIRMYDNPKQIDTKQHKGEQKC